jgi:(4S)-4-hydroxy-5-phosphonooxypentane-2,3-dione isomerase
VYPVIAQQNRALGIVMLKTAMISAVTMGLAFTAWTLLLLPLPGIYAAADAGPLYVNVVDIDIQPGQVDKFLAALKLDGAAAMKEPGCHEFNISVSQKDPNHVFIFEIYDNAAALDAHRNHVRDITAGVKDLIVKSEIRPMSSIALNRKSS